MQSDLDCVFCKIVAGSLPAFKLLEDAETLAIMDINPVHDGHCLVIARPHYPTVFDITPEAFAAVARAAVRLAGAVRRALMPEGLNLVQANGPAAQQSVPHLHIHVLPRRPGDELKFDWGVRPGDRARLADLAERIRGCL